MSSAIEMSPATTRALRITGWSFAAGLLALPAIAMQFTDEVNWSGSDFVFAAIMFGTVGGLLELAGRASSNLAYRVAVAAAVVVEDSRGPATAVRRRSGAARPAAAANTSSAVRSDRALDP